MLNAMEQFYIVHLWMIYDLLLSLNFCRFIHFSKWARPQDMGWNGSDNLGELYISIQFVQ